MNISPLSPNLTSTDLISSNSGSKKRKKAEPEFDFDQMFGIKVINEIIISYLNPQYDLFNRKDSIDSAKAYLIVGHLANRNDLKLVALFMRSEILNHRISPELEEIYNFYDLHKKVGALYRNSQAMLSVVKINAAFINYCGAGCMNQDIALVAVKDNPDLLRGMLDKFQDDAKVVKLAVQKDGMALVYASKELQDNREIVLAAYEQNPDSLGFASSRLQQEIKPIIVG